MKFFFIIIFFFIEYILIADDSKVQWKKKYKEEVSIIIDNVKKRNEPGCERLGNVYGYCEWLVVLKIRNNSNKPLKKFCSYLRVNQRNFDFCYGSKNKIILKKNNEKKVLLNLNKLVRFPNSYEQPIVKLSNKKILF